MEMSGVPLATFVMLPSAAQRGSALMPMSAAGIGAGRPLPSAVPGLKQPPTVAPASGLALPCAAAVVLVGAARRHSARRARRAVARLALADAPTTTNTETVQEAPTEVEAPAEPEEPEAPAEKKKQSGWGLFRGQRRTLEERLLDELAEERESTSLLRAQREIQEAENTARIGELTTRVEKAKEREDRLRARLKAVKERKASIDTEAANLALEGKKWAPTIREQNVAIRSVVEVAERLQKEEAELTAQLAEYDKSNAEITKDMQTAEDMVAGYFAKRQ